MVDFSTKDIFQGPKCVSFDFPVVSKHFEPPKKGHPLYKKDTRAEFIVPNTSFVESYSM